MRSDINNSKIKFSRFDLDGNNSALDFVNTVEYRNTEKEIEWITSYIDSICWAERVSVLTPVQVSKLAESSEIIQSDVWLNEIYKCRKILYKIISAVIDSCDNFKQVEKDFNFLYRSVHREIDFSAEKSGFIWRYPEIDKNPLGFLQPVVQSAADLLVSGNLNRLKKCSDPDCGWLYYDTSRNNSRRWCCMKTCGNRAKANRFYKSHK